MSTDLKFSGDSFDISFTDNDVNFVVAADEVSQNSQIRLQFILGEQFNDTRIGMPWLTSMVDPQLSIEEKKQIIRRTILSVPNVRSLDSLVVGVDDITGLAEGTFTGTTDSLAEFAGII